MQKLSNQEISRYGRQLILPEWGIKGQALLKSSCVLVVGVGGLGCPAALYLAAAGVGVLGLLDHDLVELNNLHRQVLHSEHMTGKSKVSSAQHSLNCVNSLVDCRTHHVLLCKDNAMDLISSYDVVLDCTDNVATRYLLNDACVILDKSLVSGSALRFEGQLTVYHHDGGPCYRCLFPIPPSPDTVTTCSEGGVMGPVPGVIGTMQALEALKIASGTGTVLARKMFVFDGLTGCSRTVKLRERRVDCVVCGENPSISSPIDYELFCGSCDEKACNQTLLNASDRISCQGYNAVISEGEHHVLIDVRQKTEFEICHLNHALNIPLKMFQSDPKAVLQRILDVKSSPVSIYVCCRHGNDSQLAVQILRQNLSDSDKSIKIKDLIGGLSCWTDIVDQTFPKY